MNKKLIIGITSFVLLAGFFLAVSWYQNLQKNKLDFLASKNSEVFVRDYSPTLGSKNAKVYVTEFMDPECESCRAFHPYVKSLIESYHGDVKLVIRYMPYHHNSKMVIKILEAAKEQGRFWDALDIIFKYQPTWGDHNHPRPELIWTFLEEINLDISKLKNNMQDKKIEDIIAQDIRDAETVGVKGTPTFFVNGKAPKDFGISYVKELIDAELKK